MTIDAMSPPIDEFRSEPRMRSCSSTTVMWGSFAERVADGGEMTHATQCHRGTSIVEMRDDDM